MTINVTANGREIIHTAESLEAARVWLHANRDVCFYEQDNDYPECADAYLYNGDVVAIQPEGFRL